MSLSEMEIYANLQRVMEHIHTAARSARRSPEEIQLVVVSKRQPVELVENAARAGVTLFGENYAEEIGPKRQALMAYPNVAWHMIGHIQSRKAKIVAETVDYVHSLDSLELAQRLNRLLEEKDATLPVLLEMNVSSEESKSGWPAWDESGWEQLLPDIEGILACPRLRVRGLMTMPPLYDDPEEVRPFFTRLARLRDVLARRYPAVDWKELSMGTSSDYAVGIQEGATFVRIGQAILGPRPARNSG